MKKAKKIIALVLVLALTVAMSVAGTIAFLSDDDEQINTFTVGNVDIDLWEDFGDNNDTTLEKLMPSTGKDESGKIINAVEKEVYVTNDGSEDAYVRVHIAIPSILDDGADTFDAGKNVLHFNYATENVGAGKWNWTTAIGKTTGEDWNYYTTTISDIAYNVYVVTYETALKTGDTTPDAIHQVYLDGKVTNEDIAEINDTLGEQWHILVAAEGTQAQGFADAYEALNTTFGVPGEYWFSWEEVATFEKYVPEEELDRTLLDTDFVAE